MSGLVLAVVSLAISVAVVFGGYIGLTQLILYLAELDTRLFPFKLYPAEGTTISIMVGTPEGPLDKVVGALPHHHIDENNIVIRGLGPDRGFFAEKVGVVWSGFNRKLFVREVRYLSWEKLPDKTEFGLVEKKRSGEYFFRWIMAIKVEILTKGNFTVRLILVFPIEVWKPEIAYHLVGAWERRATSILEEACREYAAGKDFDDLRKDQKSSKKKHLAPDSLVQAVKKRKSELLRDVGVRIPNVDLIDFELTEATGKVVEATQAVAVAKLEADAKKHEARGITTLAGALRSRIEAYGEGEIGAKHHLADAITDTKVKALGLGGGLGIITNENS